MYSDIEDLIESQPADKTMHEWEQSTIEAEHIIKPLTVEGQTVLDSFMGSGTTVEAAIKLGRKSIGIENNKKHFSNAAFRLNQFANSASQLSRTPKSKEENGLWPDIINTPLL